MITVEQPYFALQHHLRFSRCHSLAALWAQSVLGLYWRVSYSILNVRHVPLSKCSYSKVLMLPTYTFP